MKKLGYFSFMVFLVMGLATACGKGKGKVKLDKIKVGTDKESAEKTAKEMGSIFDAVADVDFTTNPIAVMKTLEKAVSEKFGGQGGKVGVFNGLTFHRDDNKFTAEITSASVRIQAEADGSGSAGKAEDMACEERKEQAKSQGKKAAGATKNMKNCDRFSVQMACLKHSEDCADVVFLINNITQNYIVAIFSRELNDVEVTEEQELQITESVQPEGSEGPVKAASFSFSYQAMANNTLLQGVRLKLSGSKPTTNGGGSVDYNKDAEATLVLIAE